MKKLVVTRADNNIKEMCDLTHPLIIKKATDWGAEFKILSHDPPFMTDDKLPHFRILKVKDLLFEYDRVLVMDTDMLITPYCPNPFHVVPDDCIGTIYEDKGSRRDHRRELIRHVQRQFGFVSWTEGYINTGFIMLSRMHNPVFDSIKHQYWTGWGSDDIHIGYNIHRYEYKVHELSYKWNHMSMFSEPWNGSPDRFNSYVIHYAGKGKFGAPGGRMNQMRLDFERLYPDGI